MKLLADDLAEIRDAAEVSLRTINYDMKYLRNLGAEITQEKRKVKQLSGKTGVEYIYKYANSKWTFRKQNFDPESLASIRVAMAVLRQIPGMQLHHKLKDIYKSMVQYAEGDAEDRPYILFDNNDDVSGLKHVPDILHAIVNNSVVVFEYRPFGQDLSSKVIMSPYLLKEFESRWYLVGYHHVKKQIRHYGLDRIVNQRVDTNSKIPFLSADHFDPKEHFKYVIGVSITADSVPRSVRVKINKSRAIHVDHAPLHHSQTFISEDDSTKTYDLQLVQNYELENLLLSYGKDIEVVEPADLRSKMKDILTEALHKYSNVCK